MSTAGIKVFQALSVKDHPTIIDDKHSPNLSNVRIDDPIGALSNIRGIEKYNSVGYGNPIVAIHQLNGHIFSLKGSSLHEGYPTYASTPSANAGADQSKDTSDTVTLDGSASANAVSYLWTQTSGTTVTLSDATSQKPTFTMPSGDVAFSLKVTNYWGNDTDTVKIWNDYTAITNCEELQAMKDDLAGKYYLANDIDCTYCTQDPAGALYNGGLGFDPVGIFDNNKILDFHGTFDGNGHTITGLFINRPATDCVGLFGSQSGTVKNGGMINVDISGDDDIGGLIGYNHDGTVTDCYATGTVSGDRHIGGLVGWNGGTSTITDCYATGAVSGGDYNAGGLVGVNMNTSTITDCYATGAVSGSNRVAGLVGVNNSTITNCYATGAVSGGSNLGGLVGLNVESTTYNDCFWDTQTSGQATSAGGTGKTTAQMKQEATFTNWDFSTIWAIVEDTSYPTLR